MQGGMLESIWIVQHFRKRHMGKWSSEVLRIEDVIARVFDIQPEDLKSDYDASKCPSSQGIIAAPPSSSQRACQ
jgi:hypothetical protein